MTSLKDLTTHASISSNIAIEISNEAPQTGIVVPDRCGSPQNKCSVRVKRVIVALTRCNGDYFYHNDDSFRISDESSCISVDSSYPTLGSFCINADSFYPNVDAKRVSVAIICPNVPSGRCIADFKTIKRGLRHPIASSIHSADLPVCSRPGTGRSGEHSGRRVFDRAGTCQW